MRLCKSYQNVIRSQIQIPSIFAKTNLDVIQEIIGKQKKMTNLKRNRKEAKTKRTITPNQKPSPVLVKLEI